MRPHRPHGRPHQPDLVIRWSTIAVATTLLAGIACTVGCRDNTFESTSSSVVVGYDMANGDAGTDLGQPLCGDGVCDGTEDCSTCPDDCGTCGPFCGDGVCDPDETCETCPGDSTTPGDCGSCGPTCGDGTCDPTESCSTCSDDCGQCPVICGDGVCSTGEDCVDCPGDCGSCPPPYCGDGICNGGEDCTTCDVDCGSCNCSNCVNVLQVFDQTTSSDPPSPSCMDVANWIALSSPFDPSGLSLGSYWLESADLPGVPASAVDVRNELYAGNLISFALLADEGARCLFVAKWDAPLYSQWAVEVPPPTPIDDTTLAPNPCDNGWAGQVDICSAELDSEFDANGP